MNTACRICKYGDDDFQGTGGLIQGYGSIDEVGFRNYDQRLVNPCECSGSIASVHVSCLQKWIEFRPVSIEDKLKCEVCKTKYKIKIQKRIRCSRSGCLSATSCFYIFEIFILCLIASTLILFIPRIHFASQKDSEEQIGEADVASRWNGQKIPMLIIILLLVFIIIAIFLLIRQALHSCFISSWVILVKSNSRNGMLPVKKNTFFDFFKPRNNDELIPLHILHPR